MRKLSIIIVNYNVAYFLDQCIQSVITALEGIDGDIYVVDNNSVDGSVDLVKQKYPQVHIIENKENVGFSKANNQAIRISNSEYVLLLNPDTLVQDDTLSKVIDFMDSHEDAGGLGIQMIDGKGNFLPESKRALPTPMVAFYKIFGLSKLFPNSKRFGKYHLSYLDRYKIHEVDVLSGAFMLIRKSVLDKIGLLDESFFMYGEDIDLSYRITLAGYKNYYYPDTKIIHYKGESTKKGSLNYVLTFYNAMKIFAYKHYSHSKLKYFVMLIQLAILFRATLAILHRFFRKIVLPVLDFSIILVGFWFITNYWEQITLIPHGSQYPQELIMIALPIYVFIWLISSYLSGSYDKTVKIENILKGIISGTIVILLVYSVLDVSLRFSRALIFLGSLWALLSIFVTRLLSRKLYLSKHSTVNKRFLIIGKEDEPERVKQILIQSYPVNPGFIGFISSENEKPNSPNFIGTLQQLSDIIRIYNIDEVVFCAKDMSASEIIDTMTSLQHTRIDMKIAPSESIFIIGSNSINSSGDMYILDINNVDKESNRRNKRTIDILISLFCMVTFPINIFIVHKPLSFLKNIFLVLFGLKTWVGYIKSDVIQTLPIIKNGVLSPLQLLDKHIKIDNDLILNLNLIYARDYRISSDIKIIWKGYKLLGN